MSTTTRRRFLSLLGLGAAAAGVELVAPEPIRRYWQVSRSAPVQTITRTIAAADVPERGVRIWPDAEWDAAARNPPLLAFTEKGLFAVSGTQASLYHELHQEQARWQIESVAKHDAHVRNMVRQSLEVLRGYPGAFRT